MIKGGKWKLEAKNTVMQNQMANYIRWVEKMFFESQKGKDFDKELGDGVKRFRKLDQEKRRCNKVRRRTVSQKIMKCFFYWQKIMKCKRKQERSLESSK